jgi:hypothetical protein
MKSLKWFIVLLGMLGLDMQAATAADVAVKPMAGEPSVSLRSGRTAGAAEVATATALKKAGWTYVMPKPKSAQAAWGNKDGRTTWFLGYWQQTGSTELSVRMPAKQVDGSFKGDGAATPGAWKNGGSPPAPSNVEWLCSITGGPRS